MTIEDVRASIRADLRRLLDRLPQEHKHELPWLAAEVHADLPEARAKLEALAAFEDWERKAAELGNYHAHGGVI